MLFKSFNAAIGPSNNLELEYLKNRSEKRQKNETVIDYWQALKESQKPNFIQLKNPRQSVTRGITNFNTKGSVFIKK